VSTSLIYKNAALYEFVNLALDGRHHSARYRILADLVPARSSVVDLCCGPAALYHRYLRSKSVHYTGLDISPAFVEALNKRGGHGLVWDLRSEKALPSADYVVIQGALYFFLPDPSSLIGRMLAAATRQVIVAESIRNLSSSQIPLISNIAMRLAGAVKGNHPPRFTEETFDRLFQNYPSEGMRSFKIPGGRDKVYVLEKLGASAVVC
jgi:trans-aconitate methyltransferase